VRIEALRIERVTLLGMSFEPVNGLRVFRMLRLAKDFQEMLITGNTSAVFGRAGARANGAFSMGFRKSERVKVVVEPSQ